MLARHCCGDTCYQRPPDLTLNTTLMFLRLLLVTTIAFLTLVLSAWLFNHVNPYLGIIVAVVLGMTLLIYLNQQQKK
jgi:hypothetical protein